MPRLAPVPFVDVRLTGAFWSERLVPLCHRIIPSQHARLSDMTILDSLKLLSPPPPGGGRGADRIHHRRPRRRIITLTAPAQSYGPGPIPLYMTKEIFLTPATLTAIPRYLRSNRNKGFMPVRIPET